MEIYRQLIEAPRLLPLPSKFNDGVYPVEKGKFRPPDPSPSCASLASSSWPCFTGMHPLLDVGLNAEPFGLGSGPQFGFKSRRDGDTHGPPSKKFYLANEAISFSKERYLEYLQYSRGQLFPLGVSFESQIVPCALDD